MRNLLRFDSLTRDGLLARITLLLLILILGVPAYLNAGGGPNVSGAKIYIQQNELDKAIEVLMKEINERDKENEDAWYLLGYVYARQLKYEKMIEAFNKAVELKPKFAEEGVKVSKDSGKKFFSQFGRDMILRVIWGEAFNDAVKYFNEALNAPDDTSKTELFEKSVENFRGAALIQPDSLMTYRNWSAALMNMGHYEESIEPLEKALSLSPDDGDLRLLLATSYLQSGKKEEAMGTYQKALETDPNNFKLLTDLGTLYLEENEYDEALKYLSKAHEIDPESAVLNYQIGAAHMNKGVAKRDSLPEDSEDAAYKKDYEMALPFLAKSLQLNQDDESVWAILGRLAGQVDKFSLAGYAFSKGDQTQSVIVDSASMEDKVQLGMVGADVKALLGEPDQIKPIESEIFGVQEWVYKQRDAAKGKIAIALQINIYVQDDKVDALMVFK